MFVVSFKRWSSVVIFLSALVGNAFASFHLADSNTAVTMIVFIDTGSHPTLNGSAIHSGDEIGVFDSLGNCYGMTSWPAGPDTSITVWGYNGNTGNPGMQPGATMFFKVWDTTRGQMPASVTYYPVGGQPAGWPRASATSQFTYQGISDPMSITGLSAPIAPALSSPASGSTNIATSLALSWTASSEATSYAIQVSTVSTFVSTVSSQTGITGTSGAVSGLGNNTTYYWRANATNFAGTSTWSGAWSFTTVIAAPAAPTLVSPANGAANETLSPTLSWGVVTNAASYGVQVSTVTTFASMISNQSGLAAASAAVSGLSNGITYYWRANATNAGGTSVWSSLWSFTTIVATPEVPTLTSPANGATSQATSLALSWGAVTGAASYGMQVSTVTTFASMVSNQSGLAAASAAVSGLSNSVTYYWRANATNAGGTSAWSGAWSFTTVIAAPSAPVPVSPASGAANQATALTLTWGTVANAASYDVQASTVATFASMVSNQSGLVAASAAMSGLSNSTTYYWRVNATNAGGTSAWSSAWSFTTIVAVPGAPTLSSPVTGASGQSTSPALSWGAVTGAASYSIHVSTIATFASTVSNQAGITAITASVSGLSNSTTYYWQVNATNVAGTSAWSGAWSFTTVIAAPSAPVPASPASGSTNQATALTLTWGTVTNAASYDVQVSTVATFASMVSNQSGLVAASAAMSGLSNSITYYWRVNATNAGGTSTWSSAWSFTTIVAVPGAPTLSSPPNGASNQPVNLTLGWSTVSGASTYEFQLSTVSNFSSNVLIGQALIPTSIAASGLINATSYYWRAAATNGGGTGAWSTVWSFTTVPAVPAAPTPTSPANGAAFAPNATVTLSWGLITGATTYTVQVSTGSTFATFVLNQSGATSSAEVVNSSGPVHYWRVNAGNAGGTSAWSAIQSFTTTTAVLPTVGNEVQSSIVNFAHGALSYSLKAQGQVEINIFDILGKKVLSLGYLQTAGSYRLPLNEMVLPSGRYLLRFRAEGLSRDLAITITR